MVLVSPVSLEMRFANLRVAFQEKLRYIARCRTGKARRRASRERRDYRPVII